MNVVAAWFVAVAVTAKLPLTAAAADVTCNVAVEEAPGDSDSADEDRVPVQLAGTVRVRSNVEAAQAAESLLVTEMVKETEVPEVTPALVAGDSVTVGLARVQVAPATIYIAEPELA